MFNNRKGTTNVGNKWECQDSCVAGTGYQQGLGDILNLPGVNQDSSMAFPAGAPATATTPGSAPVAATTLGGAPAAATTLGGAPAAATTLCGAPAAAATLCGAPAAATTLGGAPAAATTLGGAPAAATTLCGAPAAATTLCGSVVPGTMGTLFGTGTPAVTGPFSTVPNSFGYRYASASTPIVQPLVQNMQPAPDAGNTVPFYDFSGRFVEVGGEQLNIDGLLMDPLCPEEFKKQLFDLYTLQNTPVVDPYAALREKVCAQLVQEKSKHASVSGMGAAFTTPLPPRQVLNVPHSSSQMPPPSPRKVGSGAIAPKAASSTPAGEASAPPATSSTPAPTGAAGTSKGAQVPFDKAAILENWDNLTNEERKSLLKNKKPKKS